MRTTTWRSMVAMTFALGGLVASGAALAAPAMTAAEKLHRLDLMLKVSEARCEAAGIAFGPDYAAFAGNQRDALAKADRALRDQLARRHGRVEGAQAYQRMNIAVKSEYGQGHPWLGCRDLQAVAHDLALVQGSATLLEAADQVLPDRARTRVALIRD